MSGLQLAGCHPLLIRFSLNTSSYSEINCVRIIIVPGGNVYKLCLNNQQPIVKPKLRDFGVPLSSMY